MKHWFASFFIIIGALLFNCTIAFGTSAQTLTEIEQYINSYQMESAQRVIEELNSEVMQSANGKYIQGKYLFFTGNYKKSIEFLKAAISESKTELDWKYLRDQVEISYNLSQDLKQTTPQKGYTFHHKNGTDALLVPYALHTLRSQQKQLETHLGQRIEHVRVYILPSTEMLSTLCGLSVEQIESTGTVGISKYNRIMILSPRLIVGGYPWLDTLAHELTHIAITRASNNRAPIWLHEGIAKLYEAKWRGVKMGKLTPVLAYLLDKAAREKRLIPLRRFHPSVSYLPNQEDAALAYAQGLSFLVYLTKQLKNDATVQTLLEKIRTTNVDNSLKEVTKYETRKLYRWWQEELVGARHAPATLVPMMQRRFKTKMTAGRSRANIDPILDKEVRRHIRVGDLLHLRGHLDAAIIEYKWALEKNEALTPDIVNRLASALLATQKADEAWELLKPMKTLYPNHSSVYMLAGQAHSKLGNNDQAERELRRAIALDPFHPDVHCMLSAIYENKGRIGSAKRENAHCLLLSSSTK